jgi:two-component system cell cycle response regulator
MPEGTGFEMATRIKSASRASRDSVILISATLRRDITAEAALAVGANRFIRRPIDPRALSEQIEQCLEGARRPAC